MSKKKTTILTSILAIITSLILIIYINEAQKNKSPAELLDHLLLGADGVEYNENVTEEDIQEVVEVLREDDSNFVHVLEFHTDDGSGFHRVEYVYRNHEVVISNVEYID
jgi:5,10-methylenetetrahydrofolate reductase